MANYDAKDSLVRSRLLKTEEMAIPFFITHNATPGSKSINPDEPSLLFVQTQGLTNITLAAGAVDSAGELSAITFASANDASGVFSLLLRINEPVVKVISAQIIQRGGSEVINCTFPTGSAQGVTSAGDKIVLNCDSAVNFATTDYDASLVVCYVVGQS